MSWLLEVKNTHTLGFGIGENGAPQIYGDADGMLFTGGINHPLFARIRDAEAAWSIHVPEASDVAIDGANVGLLNLVRNDPTKVHGMAVFYKANQDKRTDSIGFTVAVPQVRFEQIRHLFELSLLARAPMQNIINLPFHGFREVAATTSTPSWQEFIDGSPLFFDEVSVTGRRITD